MVLVVVRDQDVVDLLRQVLVRVARDVAFVRVTQHRIKKNAHPGRLDQDAGMPEVAPPDAGSIVVLVRWRRIGRQEGREAVLMLLPEAEYFLDLAEAARHRAGLEE